MKWLAALLAVPFGLVAADWLAWSALTARLRAEYAAWARDAWSHGWVAEAGRLERGGFPFAATLTLHRFSLRGGVSALPEGVNWQVEDVVLRLALDQPTELVIAPEGRQELRLSGLMPVTFTADRIAARVPLGRIGPGQSAEFKLDAADISGGLVKSGHPRDVQIAALTLALRASRDAARRTDAALTLHARQIELPDTGRWPLGATIPSLDAALLLTSPPLPPADAPHEAAAWRDGGGRLVLQALDLRWGPLRLRGTGTAGLDERLQPAGRGVVTAEGYAETLDALSRAGVIKPGLAATAAAVLTLMARPAPDGHGVELPLSVKHSTLSVGKIPLVELRGLDWGRV